MGLRKGSAAVAALESKRSSKGGGRRKRANYFSLQDGDSVGLRFLTDYEPHLTPAGDSVGGLVVANQHSMVPTRPQPSGFNGTSWPRALSPVCRQEFDAECYVCESGLENLYGKEAYAVPRMFAYAALLDIVYDDNGKVVGFQDVITTETDADGKEVSVPMVVMVNQALGIFQRPLATEMNDEGRTSWLTHDVRVRRDGAGVGTQYHFKAYEMRDLDARDPSVAAFYGAGDYCPEDYRRLPVLDDFVADLGSDEYYRRWIIPNPSVDPWNESRNGQASSQASSEAPAAPAPAPAPAVAPQQDQSAPSSNDVDLAKLAELTARLTPHSASQ